MSLRFREGHRHECREKAADEGRPPARRPLSLPRSPAVRMPPPPPPPRPRRRLPNMERVTCAPAGRWSVPARAPCWPSVCTVKWSIGSDRDYFQFLSPPVQNCSFRLEVFDSRANKSTNKFERCPGLIGKREREREEESFLGFRLWGRI